MGRGGGHSGGGGGRSHSSGGGSFHYGSSRGGGSHSRGSSSSSSSSGGGYYHHHSSGPHYGGYHGGRTVIYTNSSNWLSWLIALSMVVVVVWGTMLAKDPIPASTQMRTKLPANECTVIDTWYEDELDWIHDEAMLKLGLKDFYKKTGVQPYLYITDNIYGKPEPTASDFENYLGQKYEDLFGDDAGHLLVCFMESSPSVYATYYIPGTKAKTVIDEEAGSILLSYIDYNYTSDMSDEEMFSNSFMEAAARIMTVSEEFHSTLVKVIGMVIIVIAFAVVAFMINRSLRNRRLQAEADARILNASVEEDVDESLLDKYDK